MGRCVARFAVLLLADLQRFHPTFESMAERLPRRVPTEPLISKGTLKDLVRDAKLKPKLSTLTDLYWALQQELGKPGVKVRLSDDWLKRAIAVDRDPPRPRNQDLVSFLFEQMTAAVETASRAHGLDKLWIALIAYVLSEKALDEINAQERQEEEGGELRRPMQVDFDREGVDLSPRGRDVLKRSLSALELALEALDAVEQQLADEREWTKGGLVLSSLRLHLQAERATSQVVLVPHAERQASADVLRAWSSAKALACLAAAEPLAVTFKIARNFIELGQYCGRGWDVLKLWDRIREADLAKYNGFQKEAGKWMPKGLLAVPQSVAHAPSMAKDLALAPAVQYIRQYEESIAQLCGGIQHDGLVRQSVLFSNKDFREEYREWFQGQHAFPPEPQAGEALQSEHDASLDD